MPPAESYSLDRRSVLRLGLLGAAAIGGASMLAACGSSDSSSASGGGSSDPDAWTFQVNWTPDITWAGTYMAAEAGLYQKNGFKKGLNFLAGGPNVAVEPIVASGKANMAVTSSETFAAAVAQGADLVAVGAFMQKNPYCVTSLPANPIRTPKDMVGKKIGVSANNNTLFAAFLKANDISEGDVSKVVVQNDPTPLANGEVDGFLSYVSNQPVTLQLKGLQPINMMISDFGFALYEDVYVVRREALSSQRDILVAGLKSEIAGWQLAIKDQAKAVDITVNKYAKASNLDPKQSALALKMDLSLAQTDYTGQHGLLSMNPTDINSNVATLTSIGIGGVSASNYTNTLLDAVYANGINLV
ncbi:ABC transporter substrate-binding protein [Gordonia polyisoprenivorans]|uniref:ABC transporter substrate-binding protein n=1 Tax=Gordonia polyisoprenivorans TaxID=84595 RepID=UPI002584C9D0|nr:ABC transporter substrate-binding protein [uncultured Gordonia sp.]